LTPALAVPALAPPRPHLQKRHNPTPSPLPPPTPKCNPALTSTRAPRQICSSKRRSPANDARTLPPSLPAPPADPARATLPPGFSPSQPQRTNNPAARARSTSPDRVRRTPAHGGQHRAVAPSRWRDHTGTRAWLLLVTHALQRTAAASMRPFVAAGLVTRVAHDAPISGASGARNG